MSRKSLQSRICNQGVCVFGKSPASDVTGHTTSTYYYIKAMNMVITFPLPESDTCLNGAISISRLRRMI